MSELILIHEPFIYNVAWKFTNNPDDASDLTQEALIKVIAKLSTFKGNSSFRTMLYRIVLNEFMQSKRRPLKDRWENFNDFSTQLNSVPDSELSIEAEHEQIYRTKTAQFFACQECYVLDKRTTFNLFIR